MVRQGHLNVRRGAQLRKSIKRGAFWPDGRSPRATQRLYCTRKRLAIASRMVDRVNDPLHGVEKHDILHEFIHIIKWIGVSRQRQTQKINCGDCVLNHFNPFDDHAWMVMRCLICRQRRIFCYTI